MPIKVKVKQTGRIKPPRLDNGKLTRIGLQLVTAQKKRWSEGINASGNAAKPLSKPYLFIKKNYTHQNRPIRDNKITGVLVENFQLRKAINNVIRAENSTRMARDHANRAQNAEQMIGFAGADQVVLFNASQRAYGEYLKTAWVPLNG